MKTKTTLSIREGASIEFHVQAVTIQRYPSEDDSNEYYCVTVPTGSMILLDGDEAGFLLESFFAQYYDRSLIYNIEHCAAMNEPPHYEPFVNDNFYTYPVFQALLEKIAHFVETLQGLRAVSDLSQQFRLLQEEFGRTSDFWDLGGTVQENLNSVISYYQKFVALSQQIMKENPQTDLISVSGP